MEDKINENKNKENNTETHENTSKPLMKMTNKQWFEFLYNRNYKLILIIPLIVLILSLSYLFYFYKQNNDFINKDISITGGTSVTVFSEEEIDIKDLTEKLSQKIKDFSVKELSDFSTTKQKAVIIESKLGSEELKSLLEEILGFNLTTENSTFESTGSALGTSFYNQLKWAILLSFILMATVVFIIFRTFIPSFIVVLSAFADIVMTLAFVNFMGMKVSAAGITAFLMLIGYSVDTDILLTTKSLKKTEGTLNSRIFKAFKTGAFMTFTALIAVSSSFFISGLPASFKQIFFILFIGLLADLINTWITNASLLKWYLESKK